MGALALAVVGLSVALGLGNSSSPRISAPFGATVPGPRGTFGGRAPVGGSFANLGVIGTVASVGSGSFTVTARSGQFVTVDEQSSTHLLPGWVEHLVERSCEGCHGLGAGLTQRQYGHRDTRQRAAWLAVWKTGRRREPITLLLARLPQGSLPTVPDVVSGDVSNGPEVSDEPVAGEVGRSFECSRLLEEVGCPGDHGKVVLAK